MLLEDDGDIVFYKNSNGQAMRVLAPDAMEDESQKGKSEPTSLGM